MLSTPTSTEPPAGFSLLTLLSPFFHTLDVRLYQAVSLGRRRIGTWIEPQHCNRDGVAHGAFLLAVADLALTYGTFAPEDFPPRVTLNLSADFIRAVQQDDWLEIEIDVKRSGRSLAFVDAVGRVDGKPALRLSGVFRPVITEQREAR